MTIKNKFIAITLVLIAILIIQTIIIENQIGKLALVEESKATTAMINVDLLELRRVEKDFLARKDMKYTEGFRKYMGALDSDYKHLKELLSVLDLPVEDVVSIQQETESYGLIFERIVALQNKIGLTPTTGLYGELRKAVHNVESVFKTHVNYELLSNLLMLRRAEKDFMLRRTVKYINKFDKSFTVINETLSRTELPGNANSEAERLLKTYRSDFKALFEAERELGLTHKDGALGELRNVAHMVEANLNVLSEKLTQEIITAQDNTQTILRVSVIMVSLVILSLVFLLGFNITRRLEAINSHMNEIALGEGDLTQRLSESGRDEIIDLSRSFNTFVGKVHDSMRHVAVMMTNLGATGEQVTEAAVSTSDSMNELRVNTQSVVVAAEELSATAKDVAENASHVSVAAKDTDTIAKEGQDIVDQAVKSIQSFATEFNHAAGSIGKLRSETENIDNILDVIRGIADQTNLLALNAAIEAARAGESGRGFAVVADEVRMLAQRSQASTDEIQKIIEQLQQQSASAFEMIKSGQERVSDTVKQAELAGDSLTKITDSVITISEMTVQIATAAEQESGVVSDIGKNIVSIDGLTQDTDTQVTLTMDASSELSQALTTVLKEIQRFKFENNEELALR